ncbi:hypothetical protein [Symmachiella dynata]|uniref:hypothetical protein n=1 Tax=Symmachiella dynata TaxID=2527995 RepID=UPI0030EC90A5|tara:strand:- start:100 stop:426 length:327 start_codon:yes stop_codon:yes gene_type:complete
MKYKYLMIAGLILIASYPLAVGPYAWLDKNGQISDETFQKIDPIFYPVGKYAGEHEMVRALYRSYLKLWLRDDDDCEYFQYKQIFLRNIRPSEQLENKPTIECGWSID